YGDRTARDVAYMHLRTTLLGWKGHVLPIESKEHNRHSLTLVHQGHALAIPQATQTPPDELGGSIDNARDLDVIAHTLGEPLGDRVIIGTAHFRRHALTRIGPIGHRRLTHNFLEVVII